MDIVGQVISAIEASTKAVWVIFISCVAVIALDHFRPDLFLGLPNWVVPSLRIVGIFSLVLTLASIASPVTAYCRHYTRKLALPMKRKRIQQQLLEVDIFELAILCFAMAEADRNLRLNPDAPMTISLEDKALIVRAPYGVIYGDGKCGFDIPVDVWRELLSMKEFEVSDPSRLKSILRNADPYSAEKFIAALPQNHPAVQPSKRE